MRKKSIWWSYAAGTNQIYALDLEWDKIKTICYKLLDLSFNHNAQQTHMYCVIIIALP